MPRLQDKIVLFGDSITEMASNSSSFGYANGFVEKYIRRLDVLNRGFSGYNTDWAMPILLRILDEHVDNELKLLTIFFGANDACIPGSYQHVPLDKFQFNLNQMIKLIKEKSPSTKIILITPPPFYLPQWQNNMVYEIAPDRTEQNTELYAAEVVKVANENMLPFVNLHKLFLESITHKDELRMLLTDGLHLSSKGYRILFDALMNTIQSQYPELLPENIPITSPPWNDFIK